jgi:hypothetical protein
MAPMHKADNTVTVRDAAPRPEIITQDEMRDLIQAEVGAAGSIPQLCRNLRMRSSTPVYLALQEEREISDRLAMHFAFERITMFRRIGHAARKT